LLPDALPSQPFGLVALPLVRLGGGSRPRQQVLLGEEPQARQRRLRAAEGWHARDRRQVRRTGSRQRTLFPGVAPAGGSRPTGDGAVRVGIPRSSSRQCHRLGGFVCCFQF
jgi:hypothetical protein